MLALLAMTLLNGGVSVASAKPLAARPLEPLAEPLGDDEAVHLTLVLRAPDLAGMQALLKAQQDPHHPAFRRFLTPEGFGDRFGADPRRYQQLLDWLAAAGFEVVASPNRLVAEANGSAAAVRRLLGVSLRHVAGRGSGVHAPQAPIAPQVYPAALRGEVVAISGLDTRWLHRRHLRDSYGSLNAGPQDLRRLYNTGPLFSAGFAGGGAHLVVLGNAEPPTDQPNLADIQYFYSHVSNSKAVLVLDPLANSANDFETGGRGELELDVEMESVGAPEAATITLVMPAASEQFMQGTNEIVNNLSFATAVSTSYGNCEKQEVAHSPGEPAAMRQLILQGVLEGQIWTVAAGDNGTDDCIDGLQRAVDFPASIPEMLGIGGTGLQQVVWDAADALSGYELENVWNDARGGAGGGGFSGLFAVPAYQRLAAPPSFFPPGYLPDAGRVVPDFSLIADEYPGVTADDTYPQVLDAVGGTSASSPLAAGFLALVADRLGCRLGDVHPALYALGLAQFDGGAQVFHDITVGNNAADGLTGMTAGIGFDPATGWGTLDVTALAAAFPPCPPVLDGGAAADAGVDGGPLTQGPPYDPCADLACQAPEVCQQLPEGPARCVQQCTGSSGCDAGEACDITGACVPGNADAGVGATCQTPNDCVPGMPCIDALNSFFPAGYCTLRCGAGLPNCPQGSVCEAVSGLGFICLQSCTGSCPRLGYACQPLDATASACLPRCSVSVGCQPGSRCEPDGGTCLIVDAGVADGGPADAGADGGFDGGFDGGRDAGAPDGGAHDAGTDGGVPDGGLVDAGVRDGGLDAGQPDSGHLDAGPPDAGQSMRGGGGCGCTSGASSPDLGLLATVAAALAEWRRRRRVSRRGLQGAATKPDSRWAALPFGGGRAALSGRASHAAQTLPPCDRRSWEIVEQEL